jgi:ankyrin repeat protein
MEASQAGDAEELKFIATLPITAAVINDMDLKGMSALHHAAKGGFVECVKILFGVKHIDVNCRDDQGWTPLHYAAQQGHLEVVETLLQHKKVNAALKNKHKQRAVDLAKTKEIITLLQYAEKKKQLGGKFDISQS